MKIDLCEKRQAILAQGGHLLVLGGPGSGKTLIALLKAQQRCRTLKPGQNTLFLSFSRAAVRQILNRCREVLTSAERELIQVKTYHSFCLEVLQSHGRLLGGRTIRFLFPGDERLRKSVYEGDWDAERQRLSSAEGLYCFDLLASGVAALFETNAMLRGLYADKYPLVIVDEFQDTDDDQWRIVRSLSTATGLFCLADSEQRIFEYRTNIDPKRVEKLKELVHPAEFDFGGENHRSRTGGILGFADALLQNRGPLPKTSDVKLVGYYPKAFESVAHAAVIWTFDAVRKEGITDPCVAVLCRSNAFVAKLSAALAESHKFKSHDLAPVEHDVVWDAELAAASAAVVGSILEWPSLVPDVAVRNTLRRIAHYYRLKNAEHPSKSAAESSMKYEGSASALEAGRPLRLKAAKDLVAARATSPAYAGDPVEDWKRARRVLQDIRALNELFREARLVRLFRATDALAAGLAAQWLASGTYHGAADLVKRVLDRERLVGADRDPRGCVLMTIHKSKGKEFDGVVLVEGHFESPFFDNREGPPHQRSRRLLRVGITRARRQVTIVRPQGAAALVAAS